MKKTIVCLTALLLLLFLTASALCEENALPDGLYSAVFTTDSTMFRLNETCEGRGLLTVTDGEMTIHITLLSKTYQNAFFGTAEEAQQPDAQWIQPTRDEVTYPDGFIDVVHGFDIPVPEIDKPYVISMVGKKGKWYDHTVSVSDPVPVTE